MERSRGRDGVTVLLNRVTRKDFTMKVTDL